MVIFGAVFLVMTLLILYGSNSSNDYHYTPLRTSLHSHNLPSLKKWEVKDGYLPVYGNKASVTQECRFNIPSRNEFLQWWLPKMARHVSAFGVTHCRWELLPMLGTGKVGG